MNFFLQNRVALKIFATIKWTKILLIYNIKFSTKCSRIPEVVQYKGRHRSETQDQSDIFNKFFCDQFYDASDYWLQHYMSMKAAQEFYNFFCFFFFHRNEGTCVYIFTPYFSAWTLKMVGGWVFIHFPIPRFTS